MAEYVVTFSQKIINTNVRMMKALEKVECYFPKTLSEAVALLAQENSRGLLLAGGTDLMAQWESGLLAHPDRVISIWRLPELMGISETPERIVVGASVTHAELRNDIRIQRYVPALSAAAATIGARQIQARGTIGGNVANASPAGDLAPALLVTDGSVVVAGPRGEREISLSSFFLDYRKIDLKKDELIVRFLLPKLPEGNRAGFRKLGQRAAQAISKVMGAYRVQMEGDVVRQAAIALGSVAPTSVRLYQTEEWLAGKKLTDDILDKVERRVQDEVTPIDDIRSTAVYRKWVSGRLVRGLLHDLVR